MTRALCILPPLLLLLSGCASLDKSECLSADWYAIGLEDGAQGRPLERLGEHRRACAEHAIAPDPARYQAGRDEGLKSFCTYERGYRHGRAGQSYAGSCPAALAAGFVAGYQRGRELHQLHGRLSQVQSEIGRIKAAIKDGIPNPRTRATEVERLESLSREAEQLHARIAQVESGR
jgi:hypothetical protein